MKNYLYDGYLSTFIYREIGKKLNISFDEFLARPRYEIESIIRIVEDIDKKKMQANESALNDLERNNRKNMSKSNMSRE